MTKKNTGGKIVAIIFIALIAGAAGFGYFKQTSTLTTDPKETEESKPAAIDDSVLQVQPSDIIVGDMNALVTIVEYSSLSCPHCAHFHKTVYPEIMKKFVDTGKAKIIIRHFPLNAPAMRGSMVVECAGGLGMQRSSFIKTLFEMQDTWAMGEDYSERLKQIVMVGGIDSATYVGCVNDKTAEAKILAMRQQAEEKLGVTSTPSFFINGTKYAGEYTADAFGKAITDAETAKK